MMACANNASPNVKVPEKITVTVDAPDSTTVHVIHEIAVSVELQAAFEDDCIAELGPNTSEEALNSCKNDKIQKYIEQFIALISQANQTSYMPAQGGTQ